MTRKPAKKTEQRRTVVVTKAILEKDLLPGQMHYRIGQDGLIGVYLATAADLEPVITPESAA